MNVRFFFGSFFFKCLWSRFIIPPLVQHPLAFHCGRPLFHLLFWMFVLSTFPFSRSVSLSRVKSIKCLNNKSTNECNPCTFYVLLDFVFFLYCLDCWPWFTALHIHIYYNVRNRIRWKPSHNALDSLHLAVDFIINSFRSLLVCMCVCVCACVCACACVCVCVCW